MKHSNYLILILGCMFLTACSGTRNLPYGEKLYVGAEIKLVSNEKINKRKVKTVVQEAFRPQVNKTYFGMRPKLWMYTIAGENPKSKIGKWIKKKGEAPVLMSEVKPGVISSIIDASLFNIGIFNSFTESEIIEKKNSAKVRYISHIHKPFIIKELTYDISDDNIRRLILNEKEKSLIRPGADYNLELLKNERIRIDALLKNNGYFYFNPDYLLFKADTLNIDHSVSFKLTLKDSIPKNALTIYRINNVFVNQNYSLGENSGYNTKDTILFHNIIILGKETDMEIRPKVISESVYLRKHDIFSRLNYTITLNRLMSMGNFKLVQVNFSENVSAGPGLLDVTILITPMSKYTFRAEIDLVSKSNNYTGPRMNLSVFNRNTFKGAELLNFNLAGSFESQFNGKDKNLYSYAWNPQLELTFPRFIVPFKIRKTSSIYIPKTNILLSYNYLKRVNYFDMSTFKLVYGYKWKKDIRKEHELNLFDISYSSIGNKSVAFAKLLESNPFLKKSYEEQFIAGGNYSFTYNEQVLPWKKTQFYIHIMPELAGNVFSLVKLIGGEKISQENPLKVAGSIYSQYAKISLDGRLFYNFSDKDKLAMRFYAGVGKSFGNSSILPYTKQFFSGGPNSIRAFQINSVGPGNYFQDTNNKGFLQLGGDIKLEMNAEYRFSIFNYFKGALFVDAGNVWLLKSNPANAGTPFSFSGFTDQLAVGSGIGLRIDVSFFILRFDLAIPLRKPWLEENHRWVINQIDPGSSTWRSNNLVLNVAIGYPF